VLKFQASNDVNQDTTLKSLVARLLGKEINPPRAVAQPPDNFFDDLQ
jgi:hypothetical protein